MVGVEALEGVWNVERLSGPLPVAGVWKRVWGVQGETRVWGSPGIPFMLERREKCVALVYRPPLAFLVDELRLEESSSWIGRATVAGLGYAWFRMVPMEQWRNRRP